MLHGNWGSTRWVKLIRIDESGEVHSFPLGPSQDFIEGGEPKRPNSDVPGEGMVENKARGEGV